MKTQKKTANSGSPGIGGGSGQSFELLKSLWKSCSPDESGLEAV